MAEPSQKHSLDLPLMSCISSRHIHHYVLDLKCDFQTQTFSGCITLFSTHVNASKVVDDTDKAISGEDSLIYNTSQDDVILKYGTESDKTFNSECSKLHVDRNVHTNSDAVKTENINSSKSFVLVLDSWGIIVEKVEETKPSRLSQTGPSDLKNDMTVKDRSQKEMNELLTEADKNPINFSCENHCIRIWKDGVSCSEGFPDIVQIYYTTSPTGPSLKWTHDQDGKSCVYTHGHWINNRSLFPSQDIPGAMASWRANISVPKGLTVLMTGDQPAQTMCKREGYLTHYFFSKMEMPSSTLALAIGYWREIAPNINENSQRFDDRQTQCSVPYRVFAPEIFSRLAKDVLFPYIPHSISEASHLLGVYPFKRIDVLIVPSSFNSLGMASPCLIFLSQSVLSEDGGMLVRVSHEISHSWFGLLIGPKDWTEEWLSEGFCTYTEGIIHAKALQMSKQEVEGRREILDYIKYKTLETELDHTQVDLQTLRPNQDMIDPDTDGIVYVKNGMNPDKGFTQLHYIKGYFLLCFLENLVGLDGVCLYLKEIVKRFHHQLVNSQDVLSMFIEMYPEQCKSKATLDSINDEWLDNAGIPEFLTSYIQTVRGSKVFQVVSDNVLHIKKVNASYTAMHWRKKRKLDMRSIIKLKKMTLTQSLLFLEMLLNETKLHCDVLLGINDVLRLSTANPDIQHKWCELVIKYSVKERYKDVRQFLIDHQAMGVYLFGELVLSKDKEQRRTAEFAFNAIKLDLEAGVYKTICLMVYGTENVP